MDLTLRSPCSHAHIGRVKNRMCVIAKRRTVRKVDPTVEDNFPETRRSVVLQRAFSAPLGADRDEDKDDSDDCKRSQNN